MYSSRPPPVAAELDDLREINVGDLDGHNDDSAWQVYQATLAAWRSGQLAQRFPAGESGYELATRTGQALRDVADQAGARHAIIVAHGASIRAAVQALTGQPEPRTDLATGGVARFTVTPRPGSAADIAVAAWT